MIAKGNNTSDRMIQIKVEGEKTSKGSQIFRYANENEEEILSNVICKPP